MVRGEAEALDEAASADGEPLGPIIRIHPRAPAKSLTLHDRA
jgi:hypothetical protein